MRGLMIIALLVVFVGGPLYAAQYLVILGGASATPAPTPTSGPPGTFNDVFVGPFPNWVNENTTCGAPNNGLSDAGTAISNCFSSHSNGAVFYFPAGTYLINNTITIPAAPNWHLIGHSQSDTMLKWNGPAGANMFSQDATSASSFEAVERLTLNGNGTAGTLWRLNTFVNQNGGVVGGGYVDDTTFENARTGIDVGIGNSSPSSNNDILRSTFSHLTSYGVEASNPNSLQETLWFSEFDHDGTGISFDCNGTSGCGGGGSSYGNYFNNNGTDISFWGGTLTGEYFQNVSINSGRFINAGGGMAGTSLLHNRIINSTNLPTVVHNNSTPLKLIDNQIRNTNHATAYVQSNSSHVLSVGEHYDEAIGSAESISSAAPTSIYQQDSVVDSNIDATAPKTPPFNPNGSGLPLEPYVCNPSCTTTSGSATCAAAINPAWTCPVVADEPPGISEAQLQADINTACSSPNIGHKPVVHLRDGGTINLGSTLTIPGIVNGVSCDVQLVGDGMTSAQSGSGGGVTNLTGTFSSGYLISVGAGSKAVIKGLTLNTPTVNFGAGTASGIVITSSDVPGSRINSWRNTGPVPRPGNADIIATHLAKTQVHLMEINGGNSNTASNVPYMTAIGTGGSCTWDAVNGPTGTSCALLAGYDLNFQCFGGTPCLGFRVQNGGNMIATFNWAESSSTNNYYNVFENNDSGNIVVDQMGDFTTGGRNNTAYFFNNFSGTAFIGNASELNIANVTAPFLTISSLPAASSIVNFGINYGCAGEYPPSLPSPVTSNIGVMASGFGNDCVSPLAEGFSGSPDSAVPSQQTIRNSLAMFRYDHIPADTVLPNLVDDVQISHIWQQFPTTFMCVQGAGGGC